MTLLFCDGFDHYDTDLINHKWDYREEFPFGSVEIDANTGRFGSNCLKMSDSWRKVIKAMPGGPLEFVTAGVAFSPGNGLISAPAWIITFVSGGYNLAGIAADQTHNLFYWSYDTIVAYANRPIRTHCYNYIELQVDGFGLGNVKVWLNEELVLSLTGVKTSHAGYGVAEAVMLGGHTTIQRTDFPSWIRFDDFYLTDHNGTDNTGNLGDVRVIEQLPTSDQDKEWAASAGADHYALVDDPYDDNDEDTTYVTSQTHDAKDTYGFPDLPTASGEVKAVLLNVNANKTDSGSRGVSMTAKLDTAYGDGTEKRIGADYAFHQSIMERDPNAALWTVANVNAAKIGPKLTT